jgi:hypothetical protein
MALRQVTAELAPGRMCKALAELLNAVDDADDRELLDDVEALTAALGVPGWPLDVTGRRVAQWGLSTRQVAGLIDAIRQLGVRA